MLTTSIIRVEHFKSSKTGKPVHVAWFYGDKHLPCKDYCPEWVKDGMDVNIYTVPDYRCNASSEFELVEK